MKNLYYLRHGQAINNLEDNVLIGGHFDAELTEKGVEQAKAAAREIVDSGLRFDVIISSPLQRAHNTAKAVADATGYHVSKIELFDILKERDFGELAGKPFEEALRMTLAEHIADPLSADGIDGVESLAELHARAERIIAMMKDRPEKTILLVAHGALGRSIRKASEGVAFDQPVEKIPNAKLVKLI